VAVLDWFSRYVLSWELDQTLEMPFVLAAVQRALAHAKPEIWGVDLRFGHRTTAMRNYVNLAVPTMPLLVADKRGAAETKIIAEIWNSDQGSNFTSPQYTVLLRAANVQISMNGRGRVFDNIFVERLWRSVKYEEVYLHDYANPREARQGLTRYFEFYDHERPHQALDNRTPAAV